MGVIEETHKKKNKREHLQHIILDTVALAGLLSVAVLAPNVLMAMKKFGLTPKDRQKEYISSSASKLVKRGLLKYDGKRYVLSKAGEKLLREWDITNYKLKKPKTWDQKWRVIIFDIPEKKRKVRDRVRYLFQKAGFSRLQDSVWVYPYDCEDIIGLLKTDYGIGKDVLYLIVDELENDRHLREEFKLM